MKRSVRRGRGVFAYPRSWIGLGEVVVTLLLVLGVDCALGDGLSIREVERGPHHKRIETSRWITNSVTGEVTEEKGGFVELRSGMHYLSDTGQWLPSEVQFAIAPTGQAVAEKVLNKVRLKPNPTEPGAVEIELPGGQKLRAHLHGLALYDPVSGAGQLLASVRACEAFLELPAKRRIVFANCFDDERIQADVVYELGEGGALSQDVVLRAPVDITAFGYEAAQGADLLLETWTEVLEGPEPEKVAVVLRREADEQKRALMKEPDWVSETLQFNDLLMTPGRCFKEEGKVGFGAEREEGIPVAKRYLVLEAGRRFLVEQARVAELQPLMADLPKPEAKAGGASLKVARAESREALAKLWPERKATASLSAKGIEVARLETRRKGVVVDWTGVPSSSGFTFTNDTFYISGTVNLIGTTTFDGAVLKFTNSSTARINIQGSVNFKTQSWFPCVLTSKDDNTTGDSIPGSTGTPSFGAYGNPMLNIDAYYTSGYGSVLSHIRFCYAQKGVTFTGGGTSPYNHQVRHGAFVHCATAVENQSANVALRNVLVNNATYVLGGSGSVLQLENVTVNGATYLYPSGSSFTVNAYNSLFVAVANLYYYGGSYNATASSSAGVFAEVGAGKHYLPVGSGHRDAGLDTVIESGLASELRKKTTMAPVVLSGGFSVDTTLYPTVLRDTSDTAIDRGFHYDVADVAMENQSLAGVTVTLGPGTVAAFYGSKMVSLGAGGRFVGAGLPANVARIVRYNLVGEQPLIWGANGASSSVFEVPASATPAPEVRLRFTEVNLLHTTTAKRNLLTHYSYSTTLALKDCWVRGAYLSIYNYQSAETLTLALTNNVLQWMEFYVSQGYMSTPYRVNFYLWNNLLRSSAMSLTYLDGSVSTWAIYDNVFDYVNLTATEGNPTTYPLPNSDNAYRSTTVLPHSSGEEILSTCDFVSGPFGELYYPTTGTQLNRLVDAGSRTAVAAGLAQHTVRAATLSKDTDQVAIGFHRPAASGTNTALDSEGDSIIDLIEDLDEDLVYDPADGETDWQNTQSGLTGPAWVQVFTPLKPVQ